jgi:hypothetical protein
MKEVDLATLVAVFQEMLGWTFWPLVALAAIATLSFLRVLLRDRGLIPRRLVWAEVLGVFGGVVAVFVMFTVTSSGFADMGGPIDWLLVLAIFAFGAVGTSVALYAVLGLLPEPPRLSVGRAAQPDLSRRAAFTAK